MITQLPIDNARAMVAANKGLLAMDESNPTCHKRLSKQHENERCRAAGLAGTAGALLAAGVVNNLYVLLIALSAKNAILIVEIAREGRAAGKSIIDATVAASEVRFRPILMTSFTFILGVLPLVLAAATAPAPGNPPASPSPVE